MRPFPQPRIGKTSATHATAGAIALLVALCALAINGCASVASSPKPPQPPQPPPAAISVAIIPQSATILLGNSLTFTASITGSSDQSVAWSVNSIPGGNSTLGIVSSAGVYTAPAILPATPNIQIAARSHADPTKSATASIVIKSDIGLSLLPAPASVELGASQTFQVALASAAHPDKSILWTLSGPACPLACGSIDAVGKFTAPQILPAPPSVIITARSVADSAKQASVPILITSSFTLELSVPSTVPAASSATFTATLNPIPGSNPSTVVAWTLTGAGCVAASSCGTLNVLTTQSAGGAISAASATYSAPPVAPAPDAITVIVTPQADPTKAVQQSFTISTSTTPTGVVISTLHPASVYSGAAAGFVLKVIGSGFAASASGGGATLLVNGSARVTTCASPNECTAPVTPADVALPSNVAVQIQNPDGKSSNAVSLVVAPPNVSDELITLTAGAPAATGKDIVVVEPTTAGVSVPGNDVDLNVAALGIFSSANNSCTLGGNPILLPRAASGNSTADVCLFSESGLDPSMSFAVSGSGDVSVIARQPVGLGIIRLTLQISASAVPSSRTLFIQNSNLDKTAATGALWIQ